LRPQRSLLATQSVFAERMANVGRRLTGFLLGATLAGSGMYYYVLNEYRVSNEMLTEDMFVRRVGRGTGAVLADGW
jgi:hypothetical protein